MPSAKTQPSKIAKARSAMRATLVVAGMHRSGTSAMARMLSLAGARLPDQVIAAGPDNPLGFWEPARMVDLSDRMLASVGSRWDDVFGHRVGPAVWERRSDHLAEARSIVGGDAELSVLKDPRASLMIRFWDEALRAEGRRPVYVVMVRHPREVAASIARRGDASEATAILAWTACMLAVERDTRGLDRLFVDYDDLLTDWRGVLRRVEAVLGATLPAGSPETEAEIDAFLSPAHRHHHADSADAGLPSIAASTLAWMRAAGGGTEPDPAPLAAALAELEQLAAILDAPLRDLRAEAAAFPALRNELAEAKTENAALRALADQFHAEADHNGRHWEASREMVDHLNGLLHQARTEAAQVLAVRHELGLAEARALRQANRTREVTEVLEEERRHAAAARAERAAAQAYIDHLEAELDRLRDEAAGAA